MGRRILVMSYRDLRHPEMGGAEIILYEVYRRIHAAGHPVTFLTCRFPGASDRDQIDGMEVIRVGGLYDFNFTAPLYLRRKLRDRVDVVVEDLNKLPFYTPAFVPGLPVLVNVPHLFGTTVFQQAPFPLALYVYAQEQLIPLVYRECEFQVLSESTRDDLSARGIAADRLHVVRSGIDHEFYAEPERAGRVPGPVVLYLGRLKKYKCIEHPILVLKEIAERVPQVEYWIAGEGDFRGELERIAAEQGVTERVRFLGFQEGEAKLESLRRTRVLVYTSPKEGWGLSVIEANAMGIPCVASHSPGLRESVRDGVTGHLVPHGDLPALRDRLIEVLDDDALWRRFSAAAVDWAARFSWDNMAEETLALIERAARGGTRTTS